MSDLLRAISNAGKSAITALNGETSGLSDYLENLNKKGKQQYNREQSQRRTRSNTTKETVEEYNRRKAEELVSGKSKDRKKNKYNNAPELVRKIGVHHNSNKIKDRGYNRG